MERIAVGVDLGGTKIEIAVVRTREAGFDADARFGEVLDRERIPTRREDGYDAIIERVASLVEETYRRAGLREDVALGIGMPGAIERRTGFVKNSNTTCLNGRPFRSDLQLRLRRSIAFDNDANCFALAEARLGAARAHRGVVFGVIMGTGVGGGLVMDGRVWAGLHGIAGEWGHHVVETRPDVARLCYCGARGCLETITSGPALERAYAERSGAGLTLADIAAQRATDAHAAGVLEDLIAAFGRGVANVIDILDPSAIVLGGGVSNLDLLYDEGRARVEALVFNDELLTPILRNELGDSAGVLGAALLP